MTSSWQFHHIGVAVAALPAAIRINEQVFGLRLVSGPFDDPRQGVAVCFLADRTGRAPLVELVAPLGGDSPVASYLARGIGAYHTCYEVDDLEAALEHARAHRCMILNGPTPAVAFDGRPIAWFFSPTRQLTELLQAAPAAAAGRNTDVSAAAQTPA